MKTKYTLFQQKFIERLKDSDILGGCLDDKYDAENTDEFIGKVGEVINIMTVKGDGMFNDWEPILDFLLALQVGANQVKKAKSPDPLVLTLFKSEEDCLLAFKYVSILAIEIYCICKFDSMDPMYTLWQIQELVKFPIPGEKGVGND